MDTAKLLLFKVAIAFLAMSQVLSSASAQTKLGYYASTCPNVESLVKSAVDFSLSVDPSLGPSILRLQFHDCIVDGCDASVLIDGATAEKTAPQHNGLRGFEVIMQAKTKVEAECPQVVSCADILALATRDAVGFFKGPHWEVPLGRLDGLVSLASHARDVPAPTDDIQTLKRKFEEGGLSVKDMVTLLGGHTIGLSECKFFSYRLYNYHNTGVSDASLNRTALAELQKSCPADGSGDIRATKVDMDMGSGTTWDVSFFQNVLQGNAVLESDKNLLADGVARSFVESFAGSLDTFNSAFTESMIKLSNLGVKTSPGSGNIRTICNSLAQ